jgi:hypothetical protein
MISFFFQKAKNSLYLSAGCVGTAESGILRVQGGKMNIDFSRSP